MKRQKRLCFVFCAVMLLTGAALAGCDDGAAVEAEAKSIKLNNLSYSDSHYYNGVYQKRIYAAVYAVGLTENSSGESPVYGNPGANVGIDAETKAGTATIAVYELAAAGITGEPWKGSGEYFISVGLLYGDKVDYFVTKHKIRIRRAVTEIGFEKNFVFKKTESL